MLFLAISEGELSRIEWRLRDGYTNEMIGGIMPSHLSQHFDPGILGTFSRQSPLPLANPFRVVLDTSDSLLGPQPRLRGRALDGALHRASDGD
jgi:hypothetical protein